MVTALLGTVGVPGVYEGADGGEDVRGRREQEADGVAVAKAANDGGEEVRESVRGGDANVHANEQPHLVVEYGHLESCPDAGLGLGGRDAIGQDTGGGDLPHIFGHGPAGASRGRVRVVGQDEEANHSQASTDGSQHDEKPLPAGETMGALEGGKNGGSDETGGAESERLTSCRRK